MSATDVRRMPLDVPSQTAVMAQAGSENFPVASYVVGRRRRAQLLAIYGFARLVDDLGDEAPADRVALLDWIEHELDVTVAGGWPEHPVMRRLAAVLAQLPLPDGPFRRLIEANRRDQTQLRYDTFEQLLDYCHLSAAPIGELVLHVFGAASPERIELSDRVCAGLQVTEHLQDVAEDYERGRIYLPREDRERFACDEHDLAAPAAGENLRALVAFEVGRARSLLNAGAPLCQGLELRPRLAVAGFIAGGRAALAGIEAVGHDVLGARPRRSSWSFLGEWMRAVRAR